MLGWEQRRLGKFRWHQALLQIQGSDKTPAAKHGFKTSLPSRENKPSVVKRQLPLLLVSPPPHMHMLPGLTTGQGAIWAQRGRSRLGSQCTMLRRWPLQGKEPGKWQPAGAAPWIPSPWRSGFRPEVWHPPCHCSVSLWPATAVPGPSSSLCQHQVLCGIPWQGVFHLFCLLLCPPGLCIVLYLTYELP